MKRTCYLLFFTFTYLSSFGQHLYPEKFNDCKFNGFCLDCGDPQAQPPLNFPQELIDNLDVDRIRKAKGQIEIQVLIDSLGKPCILSAENRTNIKSKALKLQYAVNNTSYWKPAITKNVATHSSVSLILNFQSGNISIKRRDFDFKNQTNGKSVGTPEISGTNQNKVLETWTVYTQKNSDLPWDMTRAIACDVDNKVWIGTDNGIVKIDNGNWQIFNAQNSELKSTPYNKAITQTVRDVEIDKKNNKWFILGWDVYKYDDEKWTIYDSTNSPINWARKIFVDQDNNIWFTSWRGVSKFDGEKWAVIDKSNSDLPSNKTLGAFVDSKKRLWIGTFEGNVMIENQKTTKFSDPNSPLTKAYISQMYEDKVGNLWFHLYNDKSADAGIYILKPDGSWERIVNKNPKMFSENSINYFLLDEEKNTLWITLNKVGVLEYSLVRKNWNVYTNENSNVPSVHCEKIIKDKDGAIWAATYAGVIKTK